VANVCKNSAAHAVIDDAGVKQVIALRDAYGPPPRPLGRPSGLSRPTVVRAGARACDPCAHIAALVNQVGVKLVHISGEYLGVEQLPCAERRARSQNFAFSIISKQPSDALRESPIVVGRH